MRSCEEFRSWYSPHRRPTRISTPHTTITPTGTSQSRQAAKLWLPSWKRLNASGLGSPSFRRLHVADCVTQQWYAHTRGHMNLILIILILLLLFGGGGGYYYGGPR